MTPQELKISILSLAFKGKICDQNANESAKPILNNILKNGFKSKKYIPFSIELAPYDIPSNWEWCMFHNVVSLENGNKVQDGRHPYLEARYLRTHENAKMADSGVIVYPGQKGILVDGENSGEVFFFEEKGYMGSTFKLLNITSFVNERFVLLFMKLHQSDYRNNKKGAAIPHLNKNVFYEMPFPIPPMEEQERIVAKIEELLPLVDRYETAWNELEKFNKKFPNDMEKSLLNYALKGKLVPQFLCEGNANVAFLNAISRLNNNKKIKKQITIKDILDDDVPFDIPTTWKWCRIADLCNIVNGFTPSRTNELFWKNGDICWMTVEDINEQGKYLTKTNQHITSAAIKSDDRIVPPNSTFLCCTSATIGRVAINKVPMASNQQFNGIIIREEFKDLLCNEFVFLYCSTLKSTLLEIAGITTFPFVSVSKLGDLPFPLPPLDEQRRIVAKIEELLPLCRKLVK